MIKKNKVLPHGYRKDINGLRAVAVLLVLLFHLEYDILKAGFLGVDVFLVISGYLISRNILKDLELNRFSFKTFYTRRFKRLFPALFFTIILSLGAGFYLLPALSLERLGKSALSGVFSVSNIFLFNEKGYFDVGSQFKPLLHLWSLSLEEQFYFIWPLLLLGIFKFFRKKIFLILFLITSISIYISSVSLNINPEAVFYLLPFRFFEFLLGALAIWLGRYELKNKILLEIFLLSGLCLILYSSVFFNELTPMPGLLSLAPCLGTVLVIYAGEAKYSSWLLKNKLFEIIGKSSYSIYLIHWPLIVYYKYWMLADLTSTDKIIIGLASLIFGYLMNKYIENVFRKSESKYVQIDTVWLWVPALSFITAFIAVNFWISKGFPSRYADELIMTTEELDINRQRYVINDIIKNKVLEGSSEKTIIVMGNSFGVDLIYALRENGLKASVVLLSTSHKCYNFGTPIVKEFETICDKRKKENLKNPNWSKVDAIYLHDHWAKKNLGDLKDFLQEIRTLSSAPIYVFGPKMVFNSIIPDIIHSSKLTAVGEINSYAQNFAKLKDRTELNNSLIKFFNKRDYKNNNIFYIDLLDVQRSVEGNFDVVSTKTSKFLYFDQSHFTLQGAIELGKNLKTKHSYLIDFPGSINKTERFLKTIDDKSKIGNNIDQPININYKHTYLSKTSRPNIVSWKEYIGFQNKMLEMQNSSTNKIKYQVKELENQYFLVLNSRFPDKLINPRFKEKLDELLESIKYVKNNIKTQNNSVNDLEKMIKSIMNSFDATKTEINFLYAQPSNTIK